MELFGIALGLVFWPTIVIVWLVATRGGRVSRRVRALGFAVFAALPLLGALGLGHYLFVNEPLVKAAGEGDTARVQTLLARGANVNMEGEGGITPLVLAAQGGHREVVVLLLERGARPDTRCDLLGGTPLGIAEKHRHTEVAELLRRAESARR